MNPSPLSILRMSHEEQLQLLKRRVMRDKKANWTYIEHSVWPPIGCEIHLTAGNNFSRINHSIDVRRLPWVNNESTGYRMYRSQYVDMSDDSLLDAKSWKESADLCHQILRASIEKSHGIVYELKQDHKEMVGGSLVKLKYTTFHICDHMSMLVADHMGHSADDMIVIDGKFKPSNTSTALEKIPESAVKFLMINLDYFFMCYGLWGNTSELPITLFPPKCLMPGAHDIMKMREYQSMQRGKQQSLRFRFYDEDSLDLSYRNTG